MEAVSTDGNIVNCYVSGGSFNDTEEGEREGRFPGTCTTHDANL